MYELQLTSKESALIFSMMEDLSGEFGHQEIRQRVGETLLELLDSDYFASYVWEEAQEKFISGVNVNMSADNLKAYESHFQFHDPITPTLKRCHQATAVSRIMAHDQLKRTEFYNDFLAVDGLHFGLNYFAYDQGYNIGDLRIWRRFGKLDFTERDEMIVNAIGPSFVNALIRANMRNTEKSLKFVCIREDFNLTKREAEIADLMVLGLSDSEICRNLFISKPTVRTHIATIFSKTNSQRRTQLAYILHKK